MVRSDGALRGWYSQLSSVRILSSSLIQEVVLANQIKGRASELSQKDPELSS